MAAHAHTSEAMYSLGVIASAPRGKQNEARTGSLPEKSSTPSVALKRRYMSVAFARPSTFTLEAQKWSMTPMVL